MAEIAPQPELTCAVQVGLSPAGVSILIKEGFKSVVVDKGAGENSKFTVRSLCLIDTCHVFVTRHYDVMKSSHSAAAILLVELWTLFTQPNRMGPRSITLLASSIQSSQARGACFCASLLASASFMRSVEKLQSRPYMWFILDLAHFIG